MPFSPGPAQNLDILVVGFFISGVRNIGDSY